jgi:hypothetical protein
MLHKSATPVRTASRAGGFYDYQDKRAFSFICENPLNPKNQRSFIRITVT